MLTLIFVAQFAASTWPSHDSDDARAYMLSPVTDVSVETGTVVQMPAQPGGGRAQRAANPRDARGATKTGAAATSKVTRPRRPDPVEHEPGGGHPDEVRAVESSVRITVIGPDGEPRTKVVRLSGSRDGMAAPARRPHD